MTTLKSPQIIVPSEDQIEETIQLINDILERPEIDLLKNLAVKEGYKEAVDILVEDNRDIKDTNIESLKTVQGRAIAALAVDYLIGDCSQKVLVGVPLKK